MVPFMHRDRSGEGTNTSDIQRVRFRPTKRYPSVHFNRQTEPLLRPFVQLLNCIFGLEIALHSLETESKKQHYRHGPEYITYINAVDESVCGILTEITY